MFIFDYSTGINVDTRQTTFRAVSNSGTARTLKGSPAFYYVSTTVRQMYKNEYRQVAAEIVASDYGVNTVTTRLPHGMTWADGNWSGGDVSGTHSGNTVEIDGLAPGASLVALDWIQFNGHSKVYQIKDSVVANGAGVATITLNTALVEPVSSNEGITVGADVEFKLLFQDIPGVTTVPGFAGAPLFVYENEFVLREVL